MVINISNEIMDKAMELKNQGFTIKSIMKQLDISEDFCQYGTFRSKLYRYAISKEKGIEYEDNKIEADEIDVKAYYENLKHLEKSMVKLDTKQTSVSLKIQGNKPVCIAFWGDWHIGSRGLDYEQFDKDRELIRDTEGLYFIGMGDYKDNNSSYVTRSSNENSIRQNMQDLLVTNMMEEVRSKAIALIRGCFLAGTPIMMSNGTYKNIEDIKEGDMVISGTGAVRKVNKKFLNQYKGQMVRFTVKGNPYKIDGTCDHKVLGIKREEILDSKGRVDKQKDYSDFIKWYRLDELRENDYMVTPKSKLTANESITKDKAYLYGLFAAEGNFDKYKDNLTGIAYTLSITEIELAKKVVAMFESEWNCTPTIKERPEKGQLTIRLVNKDIAEDFFKHCGEYSYGKVLSEELLHCENSLYVASGLIDGDGHLKKQDNKVVVELTSKNLSDQLRKIYLNNGIPSVMDTFDRKDGIRKNTYRVTVRNEYLNKIVSLNEKTTFKEDMRITKYTLDMDEYIAYPIVSYSTFEYDGETHDFEVDVDHSYLVGGLVAHNCHDDWDNKIDDRDFVAELCKVTDSVNLWHGGMINVVVGDETYKIFARHKYKNESGLNTTNAQRNMLNDAGPCDVAALGHKHFPDMQMLDRMDQKVVYLRNGSYKKYDEFGQKIGGYSGKKSVPCVVLFPDTHKVVPFQELEDAIIYLKAVRG